MTSKTITVSQLNRYVKSILDSDDNLSNISVRGELSNVAIRSGHIFMTLKDETASIKAVMFQGRAAYLRFIPEDGMTVIVKGSISLFERDGSYQLYVTDITQDGTGKEYLRFLEILEKLKKNGTIDPESRRPIPKMPKAIGVVTSPVGAALQDVLSVLNRRYPLGIVYIYPCLVQGSGASDSIIKGIEYLNEKDLVDVIIVTRGGGSYEDLSCFNDESLAYAVKRSRIPIVSAVGHEVDNTIIDYVADLRCPTPSVAAERVSPNIEDMISHIDDLKKHINLYMSNQIELNKNKIKYLASKCNYDLFMEKQLLYLHKVESSIEKNMKIYISNGINTIQRQKDLLINQIKLQVNDKSNKLNNLKTSNTNIYKSYFTEQNNKFKITVNKINALSPLRTLSRGFTAVMHDDKQIGKVSDLKENDNIDVIFIDGRANCNVTKIKKTRNDK